MNTILMMPPSFGNGHGRQIANLILFLAACPCDSFLIRPTANTIVRPPLLSGTRIRPCLPRPHRPIRLQSSNQAQGFEEAWQAGDVYQDLALLEQAIALSNAQQDLQHKERIETLDHFAQQRRPIAADIFRYLVAPCILALAVAALYKKNLLTPLTAVLGKALDLHFWSLVVAAPTLLLFVSSQRRKIKRDMPSELDGLDPEYYRFLTMTDWEDPKTSCRNYIMCLAEQWTSAVLGIALLGPLIPAHWRQRIQIVLRLAAMAALYQYPKLLFQLTRRQQARPLPGRVWVTQLLVTCQQTPWFVALDVARLLAACQWSTLGTMLAVVGLAGTAIVQSPRIHTPTRIQKGYKQSFSKTLAVAALTWYGRVHLPFIVRMLKPTPGMNVSELFAASLANYSKSVLTGLFVLAALVAPFCHLLAFRKLLRVMYTHDVSLNLEPDQFKATVNDPDEREKRFQWRYRLAWREPKRIRTTVQEWRKGFWYWFFFSNGVQDKLRREFQSKRKSEAERQGLTIWQRLAEDQRNNPDAPPPDRTLWKKQAMDRLSQKHQRDYDRKTFDDPLGVAVHQTFGIGLGFNFDHMSKLKENEYPSTRRLQARAAKSAIRRAQDIYDSVGAKSKLDEIEDPEERRQQAVQMRQETEDEISFLAERLSQLIPTDLSLDDRRNTRIQQYAPTDYVKTSSNEYVNRSRAIETLRSNAKEEPDYLNQDNEFVDEWIKQSQDRDSGEQETALA